MFHYVYRITNKTNGRHYIGSRSSKIVPSQDLGVKYYSSSKYLKSDIDSLGTNCFRYKVIRQFETRELAYRFEEKIQRKVGIPVNPQFYNKSIQTRKFSWTGCQHTVETREKMSRQRRGRASPLRGIKKTLTDEERKKYISKSFSGRKHTAESKEKMSRSQKDLSSKRANPFKGKKHTSSTKESIKRSLSKPIHVIMNDGKELVFTNRLELGLFLGMSKHLGAKLYTNRERKDLLNKYSIQEIRDYEGEVST